LENLGGWELLALILVALFIIGPERLPKVLSDGLGLLRKVRTMARNATSDLSRELGTNIELEDLHPKTFLRKHLLSEAEEESLRKPFQDVFRDVKATTNALELDLDLTKDQINDLAATNGGSGSGNGAGGNGAGGKGAAGNGAAGKVTIDKGVTGKGVGGNTGGPTAAPTAPQSASGTSTAYGFEDVT
jgi:sec-independent protein translocase protein TatB